MLLVCGRNARSVKRAFRESLGVVTGKHEAGDIAIELGHPAALAVLHSDATVLILNPGVRGELLTNQVTAAVVCVANNQFRRAAFQRCGRKRIHIGREDPPRLLGNFLSYAVFPIPGLLAGENATGALHVPKYEDLQRLLRLRDAQCWRAECRRNEFSPGGSCRILRHAG